MPRSVCPKEGLVFEWVRRHVCEARSFFAVDAQLRQFVKGVFKVEFNYWARWYCAGEAAL